ncbi:MAG TPA: hypothetical protein VK137_05520 [Planctomycetaceae bacterium]|nr:hypothetical protein [Planctomycetaceae bacterium]
MTQRIAQPADSFRLVEVAGSLKAAEIALRSHVEFGFAETVAKFRFELGTFAGRDEWIVGQCTANAWPRELADGLAEVAILVGP